MQFASNSPKLGLLILFNIRKFFSLIQKLSFDTHQKNRINSNQIIRFNLIMLFFIAVCSFVSHAQITGRGCNIGASVAINYLGTATYYGSATTIVRVYSTTTVPIITGNGDAGYRCGYINVYSSGSKYNSQTNSTTPYPAAEEIVTTYPVSTNKCVTTSSYSSNYTGLGSVGEGTEVDYKYNDPAQYPYSNPSYTCTNTTTGVSLDDYLPILLIISAVFSTYLLRTQLLKSSNNHVKF